MLYYNNLPVQNIYSGFIMFTGDFNYIENTIYIFKYSLPVQWFFNGVAI